MLFYVGMKNSLIIKSRGEPPEFSNIFLMHLKNEPYSNYLALFYFQPQRYDETFPQFLPNNDLHFNLN